MDAMSLAVADTAEVHLKDAKGAFLYDGEKPVTATIYGPGSKKFAEVEDRQAARAMKRFQDNGNQITMAPPAEREAEALEDRISLTASIDGLTLGDKKGTELVAAIFAEPKLGFIPKQLDAKFADWGVFAGNSKAA